MRINITPKQTWLDEPARWWGIFVDNTVTIGHTSLSYKPIFIFYPQVTTSCQWSYLLPPSFHIMDTIAQ